MKIGVVTYSNSKNNYGQVLQYLATQEFLKEFGHDVFLLRIKKTIPLWKWFIRPFYYFCKKIIKMIKKKNNRKFKNDVKGNIFEKWLLVSNQMEKKHPRYFEEFRKKNFKIIECDTNKLKKYKFNAFCVGSDQTWTESPFIYFLEFAPKDCLRFSIAPSTGHVLITDDFATRVHNALDAFSFITVREKNGLELCRKAGRSDAHLVLDPTFLLSANQYKTYASSFIKKRPYIFLYLLGADIPISINEIFEFAQKNDLDVKYVASQGRDDSFAKIYATVEDWLSLIANADYVITNSFHGTALSIIFHKQFMVFPIVGLLSSMNERIENIANIFDLKDHIYVNQMNNLFDAIDWERVDSIISQNRCLMESLLNSLMKNNNYDLQST